MSHPIPSTPHHPFPSTLPTSPHILLSHASTLLALYPDIRGFILAQAELEEEYGQKLGGLVKKMRERTLGLGKEGPGRSGAGRRVRDVCIGPDGNGEDGSRGKEWKEGDESRNTLVKALSTHLHHLHLTSQTHLTHSTHIRTQILHPLSTSTRTKTATLSAARAWSDAEKAERERVCEGRKRKRGVYWDGCRDVNAVRGRMEKERNAGGGGLSSFLPSSSSSSIPSSSEPSTGTGTGTNPLARNASQSHPSERLSRALSEALQTAHHAKNDYLMSIKVANEEKGRWRGVDGPRFGGEMQNFYYSAVSRLSTLLAHSVTLSTSHYETLLHHSQRISEAYAQVDPNVDADLFAEYNMTASPNALESQRDGDDAEGPWGWEPAPGYYEEEGMNVEGQEEKVYLQNRLVKNKLERGRLAHSIKEKDREIDGARRMAQTYEANRGMGDPDEVTETLMTTLKEVTVLGIQEEALSNEIAALEAILGDDQGGQLPHHFKAGTFAVPTACEYCQGSIWGLTKPGETCRRCGLNAHVKCSQKIPADCGGTPLERKRTSVRKDRPPSVMSFSSPPASPSLPNQMGSPDRSRPVPVEGSATSSPSNRLSMQGIRNSFHRRRSQDPGATAATFSSADLGAPLNELLPDHSRYPDFIAPAGTHTGPHLPGSVHMSSNPSSSSGHETSPAILEEPEEDQNPFEQQRPPNPTRRATVIWDFQSGDADEIAVQTGQQVEILEDDDGSGWMRVRGPAGTGLMPSQYVKTLEEDAHSDRAPRQPERQRTLMPAQNIPPEQATVHRVEALYDYTATEPDESTIETGERYVLTLRTAPTEEWWEIIGEGGRRGLVPANYVRAV